jgi:hypothetical protein
MMLIGNTICGRCMHRAEADGDINGKRREWAVCECNHQWFDKIQTPQQCKDFEDENKERD